MNFGGMLSQNLQIIESASSPPTHYTTFSTLSENTKSGISTNRARCIDTQMGSEAKEREYGPLYLPSSSSRFRYMRISKARAQQQQIRCKVVMEMEYSAVHH